MADRVKISTIGSSPVTAPADMSPGETVDRAIDHWKKKFELVLPDRPELIVSFWICGQSSDWLLTPN